jgi:hypothetical protein
MDASSTGRAVAWAEEMQRVHDRLRQAVAVARDAAGDASAGGRERDVLLHCWGFCQALAGHHAGEDAVLFPALRAQQPALVPVLERLREDHEAIQRLLQTFSVAMDAGVGPRERQGHLDGIAAIMESHFRYEERMLLGPLQGLRSDAAVEDAFGPLADVRVQPDLTAGP